MFGLILTKPLLADTTTEKRSLALQLVEIQQLKQENERAKQENSKLTRDVTTLWKRVDQLNSRVLQLMEKLSLTDADLKQAVDTSALCQSCLKSPRP